MLLPGLVGGCLAVVLLLLAVEFSGWSRWTAAATLFLLVSAWIWHLRVEIAVRQRTEKSNPEMVTRLTSNLPVMVYQFRTYPTGRSSVTYTNDAIRTIYEVSPEEVKGDAGFLLDLVHPDDFERVKSLLRHSYFTLEPWSGEYRVVLPKSGVQWRFAQATVERLPDGGTLWHGFVADITEKKRAEESAKYAERMRLAADKAAESDRAKDAFLAMMSHELRTPMHSVIGFLELIQSSDCTPEQREYLESAQTGAKTMVSLLDDLLLIAKKGREAERAEMKEIELAEFLRGVAGVFRKQTEDKGLEWRMEFSEDLPKSFRSDRIRLSQCLFSLLDNAIKFTPTGSVTLKVSLQSGLLSQRLRFDVIDTGTGIPEEQLGRIFEIFARGDESISRKFGGMGLGLSRCHAHVESLCGTLTASSKEGQGSVFSIELPLRQTRASEVKEPAQTASPSSPPAESAQSPASPESPKQSPAPVPLKLHILIVEDQPINQKLLAMMLKKIGCTYDLANNGLVAVERFETTHFDAILMDLQMPEMDGISATKKIRYLEQTRGISVPVPIIAVTANAMESDRRECFDCGMNDFLPKPVRAQQLADSLSRARAETAGN